MEHLEDTPLHEAYNPKRLLVLWQLGVKGDWSPFDKALDLEQGHLEGLVAYLDEVLDLWDRKAKQLPPPPKLRHGPCRKGEDSKIPEEELLRLRTRIGSLKRAQAGTLALFRVLHSVVGHFAGAYEASQAYLYWSKRYYGLTGHRRYKRLYRFLLGQTERHKAKQRKYDLEVRHVR